MPLLDNYFDYRDDMQLTCGHCGWTGAGKDTLLEMSSDVAAVMDRECPRCLHIVLVIPFPTFAQTRAAAEAGNEEAMKMCRMNGIEFTSPRPN